MSLIQVIHQIEAFAIALAVVGEIASLYGLGDALKNLLAIPAPLRRPSHVTLTLISTLSVFVGVIGHGLLGFVAYLALGANPRPSRLPANLEEAIAFVTVQVAMVIASIMVPVLSARLRRQMTTGKAEL